MNNGHAAKSIQNLYLLQKAVLAGWQFASFFLLAAVEGVHLERSH